METTRQLRAGGANSRSKRRMKSVRSFCAQRRLQKKTNGTCARLAGPTIRMTAAGRAEAHAPSFSTGCPGYVDIIVENFMVKLHNRALNAWQRIWKSNRKYGRDKKEKQKLLTRSRNPLIIILTHTNQISWEPTPGQIQSAVWRRGFVYGYVPIMEAEGY